MASPLTSHITKGGRTVVVLSYHEVRGGAISPRSLEQRTAGSRHQANSSANIAARRLPLCVCRARQTSRSMRHQSRRTAEAIETEQLPLVQDELKGVTI